MRAKSLISMRKVGFFEGQATDSGRREVFFPYFEVSGYRTVMCMLLGKEAVEFGNREDIAQKATARFGSPHAFDWSERHDALGDQIKDCGVGHVAEGDGSGDSDSDSIVPQPNPN